MIFMQQKHFNTPRIYNNHRTNRSQQVNHSSVRSQNRQQSQRTTIQQPVISQPIAPSDQVVIINDTLNVNSLSPTQRTQFKLNERLTSIGGLFGAMSIIITGALLYAIFTAKSQDKWYYITAVLINISLLLMLMVGAIVFDRYYLKKYPNPITLPSTSLTDDSRHLMMSNDSSNRTINVNASLYPANSFYTQQNSLIMNADSASSIDQSFRFRNDIPPQYPDLTVGCNNSLSNKYDKESNNESMRRSTTAVASGLTTNTDSNNMSQTKLVSTLNQPPNYYDLYPISAAQDESSLTASSILHI